MCVFRCMLTVVRSGGRRGKTRNSGTNELLSADYSELRAVRGQSGHSYTTSHK